MSHTGLNNEQAREFWGPDLEVLATYTLQLIGPRAKWDHGHPAPIGFAAYVQEAEENLTDLLPAGYRVEIKEWDSDE